MVLVQLAEPQLKQTESWGQEAAPKNFRVCQLYGPIA